MIQKTMLVILLVVGLSTILSVSTSAQKVPFPENWVQDAGPKPEPVPDVDERGATNVAFLQDTSPNASSCIPGYADRHSIAFLNDGWYNNPRSWLADGNPPAWAEINLGKVYTVDKVVFGSEHTAQWKDRAISEFGVLVATEYNADSKASTWKEVFQYKGDPVRDTTPFMFNPVDAKWVRIDIRTSDPGPRIDEIEIYAILSSSAVTNNGKVTTTWAKIKEGF
jgi:hypothetical protein